MTYRKASKSAGLALVLVIALLPQNAGASDAEARALAQTVLDSMAQEWAQAFSARKAAYMMLSGDEPLIEIALACGFSDQAHFSRLFHKAFGDPPGRWRRLRRVRA